MLEIIYALTSHIRYDEWVDASRIMKFSEENKKLQEELKAEVMKNSDNKIKRSRKELVSSTDGKTKKRKVDQTVVDPKYKLDIQQNLKQKLVDDWENITIHKYVLSFKCFQLDAQLHCS